MVGIHRVKSKDSDCESSECSSAELVSLDAPLTMTSLEAQNRQLREQIDVLRMQNKRLKATKKAKAIVSPDSEAHSSSGGLHHRYPLHVHASALANGDEEAGLLALKHQQPTIEEESFVDQIKDRAGWLVGLLCLQSLSSFIISKNESLLQAHIVIVQFLTMLVGAGGNAGNQASVRVIRGLAVGTITNNNIRPYMKRELLVGLTLMLIIGISGCIRAALFMIPLPETIAITTSLCSIVIISIVLGAGLPLAMKSVHIDPAHSSTTIQVIMDILGVIITCHVSRAVLDSPLHEWLLGQPNAH